MAGLAALLLAGCASTDRPGEIGWNNGTAGALLGAGVGALAGSKIGGGAGHAVATMLGGFGGAVAGNEIGKSLDRANQINQQAQTTPPTPPADDAISTWRNPDAPGAAPPWRNPDAPYGATVAPPPATTARRECREYQEMVAIGGQMQQVHGTVCRQPDGSWRIQRQPGG